MTLLITQFILGTECSSFHILNAYLSVSTNKNKVRTRPRRKRTTFSETATDQLESVFQLCHYLSADERERLAERIGISESRIRVGIFVLACVSTVISLQFVVGIAFSEGCFFLDNKLIKNNK